MTERDIKNSTKELELYTVLTAIHGLCLILFSMVLGEFLPINITLFISSLVGIGVCIYLHYKCSLQQGNYTTIIYTLMFILMGILSFIPPLQLPQNMYSFSLEIGLIVIAAVATDMRKLICTYLFRHHCHFYKKNSLFFSFTWVNAIILLIICMPHFVITLAALIFIKTLSPAWTILLLHILPITLLVIVMIIDLIGIKFLIKQSSKKAQAYNCKCKEDYPL